MFRNGLTTDEWEMAEEPTQTNTIVLDQVHYSQLIEDSNLLYALRKIGVVSPSVEGEAIEFLKEEDNGH